MPTGRISQLGPLPVEWHPAAAPNWDSGRARTVNLIVIHDIEGTAPAALAVFDDPGAVASAHCVIGDPGDETIYQCVDFGATAYATGNGSVNARSLNVELPGFSGRTYDPDVLAKAAALVGWWSRAWGIPLVKLTEAQLSANGQSPDSGASGICGHQDVPDPYHPSLGGGKDHHNDPGSGFDWPRFLALAEQGGGLVGIGGLPTAGGAYFPATGFVVAHGCWDYWRLVDGAHTLGLPLSREYPGQFGTVGQWFERGRLEWHPRSDPARYDILGGLVGAELLAVGPPAEWRGGLDAARQKQTGV